MKLNNNYIPILIVSDSYQVVSITLKTVIDAIRSIDKEPALIHLDTTGIAHARTEAFKTAREYFDYNPIGFMIDSDIFYNDSTDKLINYMNKDESFIIPYVNKHNKWTFGYVFEDRYNGNVPLFDRKCKWSGLGFYYGRLPLDYHFHTDDFGEDYYFFKDNEIEPIVANINITHIKNIPLSRIKEKR